MQAHGVAAMICNVAAIPAPCANYLEWRCSFSHRNAALSGDWMISIRSDYAALPNDGKRYEILDGELFVTAAPSRNHQRVVLTLASSLDAHVRAHNLGEVDIAPFEPDIIFVATDRLASFRIEAWKVRRRWSSR
jgi:Putative restriction endonuclease